MNKDLFVLDVLRSLSHHRFSLIVEREVTSTNTLLREMADRGAPAGLALIAQAQTEGRGRLGRRFYSPQGGLYLSLLLRPGSTPADALSVTTRAAVAVCRALSPFVQDELRIKWVNDVYYRGRKVCGILTESVSRDRGKIDFLILGIGINLTPPKGGYPPELSQIAGALFEPEDHADYNRIAAQLYDELDLVLYAADPREILEEYRRLSLLNGRLVDVTDGNRRFRARVSGIDDAYSLLLTTESGRVIALRSGEVTFSQQKGNKQICLSPVD